MATILIIDDDPKIQSLVRVLLDSQGYYVGTADDGETGVARALSEAPDLVITDMNMRGVTGWEVARRIKADTASRDTKVMALSAFTSAGDRDEAFEAGCDGYDNKPIEPTRLIEKIGKILSA